MQARTHGILAHKTLHKYSWHLALYGALSLLALVALIRKIRREWSTDMIFVVIYASYFFILSYLVNYTRYWFHGIPDIAVQGRYLFPIIFIFYYLMVKYLLELSKNTIYHAIVTIVVVAVFFSGGFFWFVNTAPPGHLSTTDRGRWYDLNLEGSLKLFDYFYTVHIEPQIK